MELAIEKGRVRDEFQKLETELKNTDLRIETEVAKLSGIAAVVTCM